MKKKIMALIFSAVAVFGLSACGGGGGSDAPSNLTTLFLVDEAGFSYGGIPYKCDSMRDWEFTAPNGEFTFLPPDNCQFDFTGLRGDLFGDPVVDDIVRITDDLNRGQGEIPYECASFGISSTYNDGSFNYDINDNCVFYL
jgi:hypothetical protein